MNIDDAIKWVERYRPLIEKEIQRKAGVMGIEPEDYRQEVYEAAVISTKIHDEKGGAFSTVFWKVLRRRTQRLPRSVELKDCEEYQDHLLYRFGKSIPGPDEVLLEDTSIDRRDEILAEFLDCLTGNEKDVVAAVTGFSGSKMSCQEIAAYLGITPGAVSQIISRVSAKARVIRELKRAG